MSDSANIASEAFGDRIGWWLRSFYPGARAKCIAREFDVSEATARRWLGGEKPTSEFVAAMAARFGWRFVNFIYEPVIGTPAIRAEMDALDARLARLEEQRKIDDAAGAVAFGWVDSKEDNIAGRVAGPIATVPDQVRHDSRRESGR